MVDSHISSYMYAFNASLQLCFWCSEFIVNPSVKGFGLITLIYNLYCWIVESCDKTLERVDAHQGSIIPFSLCCLNGCQIYTSSSFFNHSMIFYLLDTHLLQISDELKIYILYSCWCNKMHLPRCNGKVHARAGMFIRCISMCGAWGAFHFVEPGAWHNFAMNLSVSNWICLLWFPPSFSVLHELLSCGKNFAFCHGLSFDF